MAYTGDYPKLYNVHASMLSRCRNPKHHAWISYGGRGIKVWPAWYNFQVFKEWALLNGYKLGLVLDRINNDGDYTPNNCRFTTNKVSQENRSTAKMLTAFGETKNASLWLVDVRCKVSKSLFHKRLARGWPVELAISLKPNQRPTTLKGK